MLFSPDRDICVCVCVGYHHYVISCVCVDRLFVITGFVLSISLV